GGEPPVARCDSCTPTARQQGARYNHGRFTRRPTPRARPPETRFDRHKEGARRIAGPSHNVGRKSRPEHIARGCFAFAPAGMPGQPRGSWPERDGAPKVRKSFVFSEVDHHLSSHEFAAWRIGHMITATRRNGLRTYAGLAFFGLMPERRAACKGDDE